MSRGSSRLAAVVATGVTAIGIALTGAAGGQEGPDAATEKGPRDENTCLDRVTARRKLRCPDLRMRKPFALNREVVNGIPVLRAANSIDSVGRGPAELVGRRSGSRTMKARQKIYRRGGGRLLRRTGATLYFKSIPGQGRYWKFKRAAAFRLHRLNKNGNRVELVEVGPKQTYCLRDLQHSHPGLPRSPNHRVYPACSQEEGQRVEHIGTSVGWSDVYPSTYHENWIELNDIPKRGCYAFAHEADPDNGIYERNERNNESSTVVYLTRSGKYLAGRCRNVRDKGLPAHRTADDTQVSDREPVIWGGIY